MTESKIILDKNLINKILKDGGVICFVTDTVWGIGCLPDNEKGVDKIYKIKGRDRTKPLILMSDKKEHLYPYIKNVNELSSKLMDEFFPGALTLVMEKSPNTKDYVTSGKNTVGIRVPKNKVFQELCNIIDGNVLATTSANFSTFPSAKNYEEAKTFIGEYVDMVLPDFGYHCEGLESTVALIDDNNYKILRQGAIDI